MALHPVYVSVHFTDSAERTSVRRYRLADEYDDVAGNWDDIVSAAATLVTAINVLTWDEIGEYYLEMGVTTGALSANVAANNQVTAFVRTTITSGAESGEKSFFEIPAWDDGVFDQDSNNLLSAAFNTAAAAVAALTVDPETGGAWSVDWSQSRTRKSGVKLS